jgi:NTE family protein
LIAGTDPPHRKKVKRALVLSGGAARGAFQVGVFLYLEERGWRPDLICGSSIGAIHAAAVGAGLSADSLARLWRSARRQRIRAFEFTPMLRRFFSPREPFSISGIESIRRTLLEQIDFSRLAGSQTAVAIAAVDLATAKTVFFTNEEITVDHVLASAAAPVFFPWKTAGKRRYFDGGLMANSPILPALARGAEEIAVVLLSPVSARALPPPLSFFKVIETAFEMMLAGPFQASIDAYRAAGGRLPDIRVIAPPRMLGLASLANYSRKQVDRLIAEGYDAARQVMGD